VTIRWTAVKNTEREAIRKNGNDWALLRAGMFRGEESILIRSPDGSDERWILKSQGVRI
jgi:hypothetical protein